MPTQEFNFDGIVGPTHNYSGLSYGNVASSTHQNKSSSPRSAAIQGLKKMKFLADLGLGQAVLPPLHRPRLSFLRDLGFTGSDSQVIDKAWTEDPVLVAVCYSASNMWTANAATVSPSSDCGDGRLHMTPANLASTLHRSLEGPSTTQVLRAIFSDEKKFCVHDPLPSTMALTDEGAANHTRLSPRHQDSGLELFVYGKAAMNRAVIAPKKFPARQTIESCHAIARRHGLSDDQVMFIQQTPKAIDAGVFHNDVISVGNQNILLAHEDAFVNQAEVLQTIKTRFQDSFDSRLSIVEFSSQEISLEDTVKSYLFNSQLVTRPDGPMTLVCPIDCQENESAFRCTQKLIAEDNPVDDVKFFDLRQSMNNGGGPACLRLRVVLDESQQAAMHQGVVLTDHLHAKLVDWVNENYREELKPDDLRDPNLIEETATTMARLAAILKLEEGVLIDDQG